MKVEVVCFGAMRSYLPEGSSGNRVELELRDGGKVADVVEALGAPRRLVYALLVNEEPSQMDRELAAGDAITLMPQFTGGSI